MELDNVKEALVYANTLIKNRKEDFTVEPTDKNVKNILLHTIDYVKQKIECDQQSIQNMLNTVFRYYKCVMAEAEKCNEDNYYNVLKEKYSTFSNSFKGTILEDYACRLLLDVSGIAICYKYANA